MCVLHDVWEWLEGAAASMCVHMMNSLYFSSVVLFVSSDFPRLVSSSVCFGSLEGTRELWPDKLHVTIMRGLTLTKTTKVCAGKQNYQLGET